MSVNDFELMVTHKCNLKCTYCFDNNYGGRDTDKQMSLNDIPKIIEYIKSVKVEKAPIRVAFMGGEPLVNFEFIKEFTLAAKKEIPNKIDFGFTTNGVLLSGEKADFLYEHQFALVVSLDGNKKLHESSRGKNWDLVISNLSAWITRVPIPVTINWTIGPYSFDEFQSSFKYLSDISRSHNLVINPLIDYDADWSDDDINKLVFLFADSILKARVNPMLNRRNPSPYEECVGQCFNPTTHRTISSDLSLYFCHRAIPKNDSPKIHTYGDMGGELGSNYEVMKKRANLHFEQCVDCVARSWCRGGCAMAHFNATKDFDVLNETQCKINKALTPIIGEMKNECCNK